MRVILLADCFATTLGISFRLLSDVETLLLSKAFGTQQESKTLEIYRASCLTATNTELYKSSARRQILFWKKINFADICARTESSSWKTKLHMCNYLGLNPRSLCTATTMLIRVYTTSFFCYFSRKYSTKGSTKKAEQVVLLKFDTAHNLVFSINLKFC